MNYFNGRTQLEFSVAFSQARQLAFVECHSPLHDYRVTRFCSICTSNWICFFLFLKFVPLGGNRPQVFAKKSGTQLQIKCSYFIMTLQLFQEHLNIADLCLFFATILPLWAFGCLFAPGRKANAWCKKWCHRQNNNFCAIGSPWRSCIGSFLPAKNRCAVPPSTINCHRLPPAESCTSATDLWHDERRVHGQFEQICHSGMSVWRSRWCNVASDASLAVAFSHVLCVLPLEIWRSPCPFLYPIFLRQRLKTFGRFAASYYANL